MTEPPPLDAYVRLLGDRVRLRAYTRAIRRVVRPGDVVADIGSGLGTLSVLAARQGARRVLAVESGPIGRMTGQLARENGVHERVQWLEGRSTDLRVPARADVCLFDDFDLLALSPGTVTTLADVNARWLKPGGRTIPGAVELWAAPVEAQAKARLWKPSPPADGPLTVDLSPVHRMALATRWMVRLSRSCLLAPPISLGSLPLAQFGVRPIDALRSVPATRTATAHALLCWMRVKLARGISFDTGPLSPPTAYRQMLLPLSPSLRVKKGEAVAVAVRCVNRTTADGRLDVVWEWSVVAAGSAARGATHEAR